MVFNTTFSYMVAVSIIGGRHDIAESGIKHNKSNRPEYS
jgi:hypothetical protein